MENEITERLRADLDAAFAVIEDAPHDDRCPAQWDDPCTCWKSTAPSDALAARDTETRRQAPEDAQVEWLDSIPHDGTFEYTVAGDCDGSNETHWRRLPRLVVEPGAWERTDREHYEAARARMI